MSQTQLKEVLAPAYLEEFSCLGSECPDNCCHGWSIPVERETYVQLRSLRDKALRPIIQKVLHRGTEKASDQNYAYLSTTVNSHAQCGLLSSDGWCKLQQKGGEQLLPDVCSTFPRSTKFLYDRYEQFASPACPEVARLLIEGSNPLRLRTSKKAVRLNQIARPLPEIQAPAGRIIRKFYLSVFSTDDLPLWQVLAVHLLIAESVENVMQQCEPDIAALQTILANWTELLANGQLLNELAQLRRHEVLHLKVLAAASRLRAKIDVVSPRYLRLIDEALDALCDNRSDAGDWTAENSFGNRNLGENIERSLRQVLLNRAWMDYYPNPMQLQADVKRLCMEYLILRFWVVGLTLARARLLDSNELAELVYLFYRTSSHSPEYIESCLTAFEQAGLRKVEHWLLLMPS